MKEIEIIQIGNIVWYLIDNVVVAYRVDNVSYTPFLVELTQTTLQESE